MLRATFLARMGSYGGGDSQAAKFSQQRMAQMQQQERIARTSSRFTVERRGNAMPEGTFIGIDLGTTNSCMTYIDPVTGMPKVIPSPSGSWVYPTAVCFDKNHSVRLCGEEARAVARSSASAVLCSGKRLIGRRYGELGRVSGQMGKTNTLHVNERGEISVEIAGRSYTVTHIIAIFLRHMKKMAEEYLKRPVDACVISVPAYFTPQQKVATEDAALIAGFDVQEVIDEPSAACLSFTVMRTEAAKPELSGNIERSMVFDLGGGTLDCAIMEHDHRRDTFTLVATHGDPILGGNDWDNVIANEACAKWQNKWKIDLDDPEQSRTNGSVENRVLQLEAERAKVHFSHSLDDYHGYQRAFHFSERMKDIVPLEMNITFQDYLRVTGPLRERCKHCVDRLLYEAGFKPSDIHNVLLVGAMTRDPPVRRDLQLFFGRMPIAAEECPPDYAVGIGAGVRAGMLNGMFPKLAESTRFVRGTRQSMTSGGVFRRMANFVWSKMEENPNAIGHRWRGTVQGLADEDIEKYAKEIVEFEATSERRLMLERTEGEANDAMQRVIKNNYRKQGMQEKTITQLTDQLKFWQYMVKNFHDHEDHLARVVSDLNDYLDQVEGYAADFASTTEDGKIDFDDLRTKREKLREERERTQAEEQMKKMEQDGEMDAVAESRLSGEALERERRERKAAAAEDEPESELDLPAPNEQTAWGKAEKMADQALKSYMDLGEVGLKHDENVKSEDARVATEQEKSRKSIRTKVLRREVPLPKTKGVEELVEHGTPAFMSERALDMEMSEQTRASLFKDYVTERAWREPPAPPGESGSWGEVKERLDAGESVAEPMTAADLRQAQGSEDTMEERMDRVLRYLDDEFQLSIGPSEDETIRCNSMRVYDELLIPTPAQSESPTLAANMLPPQA